MFEDNKIITLPGKTNTYNKTTIQKGLKVKTMTKNNNSQNILLTLGWVHPRVIEALKGITRDQLDGRRKAGKYIEGVHFIKDPVGSIMWNFENYDSWVVGDTTC